MMQTSPEFAVKKRILIADDHPLMREGIIPLLNRQPDLVCCGAADSAASTLQAVEKLRPDLLILDLRLGDNDGIEFIKTLRGLYPELPILVLSQFDEGLYAERALRAGAQGYVMKHEATEVMLNAIGSILNGELHLSRRMAVLVLNKFLHHKPARAASPVESLSDRELQVFQMVGAGITTRQIALKLNLSVKTIETHRENIKHKLGLHAGPDLVRHAASWVESNS
jgi:DNA-binding NarL/FixJ family response regulator